MGLVKNLAFKYPGFSLRLKPWRLSDTGLSILHGKSGTGKSSVIHTLAGIMPCVGLDWYIGEENIAKLTTRKRRLGVVLQHLGLFDHMSAEANVLFAAKARGMGTQAIGDYVVKGFKALDLQKVMHKKTRVLSGGERQRVALLRALVARPRFLLLDEVFSALDSVNIQVACDFLESFCAQNQTGALIVSHQASQLPFKTLTPHVYDIKDLQDQ